MASTCKGSSRGECAVVGALSARHAVALSVAAVGVLDAIDAEGAVGGCYGARCDFYCVTEGEGRHEVD